MNFLFEMLSFKTQVLWSILCYGEKANQMMVATNRTFLLYLRQEHVGAIYSLFLLFHQCFEHQSLLTGSRKCFEHQSFFLGRGREREGEMLDVIIIVRLKYVVAAVV